MIRLFIKNESLPVMDNRNKILETESKLKKTSAFVKNVCHNAQRIVMITVYKELLNKTRINTNMIG